MKINMHQHSSDEIRWVTSHALHLGNIVPIILTLHLDPLVYVFWLPSTAVS